jgi:O-antigen/teichoic acid export membrane protein
LNKKKIVSFALGPIVGAALGFVSLPVITWFYSSEDIGRISMLQVVTGMCVLLFSLGLDQAYVREYHESDNKPALLKAVLAPGLLLLLVAVAGCLLWPTSLSYSLFKVDNFLISILVAVSLLATHVSRFLSLILRMQERGLAFSMSQILPKLLFLAIIGYYVLFSFGFNLLHLVLAQTASIVMVTVVFAWNTRTQCLSAVNETIDKQHLKKMLHFGTPLIFSGLASWGLMAMDRLFLRNFSTFDQLGIYSVASSFAAAAILVQSVFSTIWSPTVYKWAAAGINTDKIDQVTEQMLAAVVFLFTLSGLFSWLVTYLLPPKYHSVQYLLVSCMAYPLFYTLSETTGIGLGITRRSMLSMTASIIAALVNLLCCYLLVPRYGAVGAGISTALAFWIFFFCRTEFAIRAWRPVPRVKLYVTTLICLMLSVSFTFTGAKLPLLFMILWSLLLVFSIIIFKKSVISTVQLLFGRKTYTE